LLYSASPTDTPAASHQFGSPRRRARITNRDVSTQTGTSNETVSRTCPPASGKADATPRAASVCPAAVPPTSRATSATRKTRTAVATIAGSRSAIRLSPNSEVESRATSGVNGGWST
jgi:hypothetical protein